MIQEQKKLVEQEAKVAAKEKKKILFITRFMAGVN